MLTSMRPLGGGRLAFQVATALLLTGCGPRADLTAPIPTSIVASPTQARATMLRQPSSNQDAGFIAHSHIDLHRIARISRFRSGVGHDFSDDRERCRSMKHYFEPRLDQDVTALEIRAPTAGRLVELAPEWAGHRLRIQPEAAPELRVVIFHVRPEEGLAVGDRLRAGQRLGWHSGPETMSDLAVERLGEDYQLLSVFDLLTPALRSELSALLIEPAELTISRSARDADPLQCEGDRFLDPPSPADWVRLRDPVE